MSTIAAFDVIVVAVSVVFVLGVLFAMLSWDSSMGAAFDKKFPPIDDDEFIRRCHQGVNRDIALRVRRIISEQLGVPYDQVYPEQDFVKDLNC